MEPKNAFSAAVLSLAVLGGLFIYFTFPQPSGTWGKEFSSYEELRAFLRANAEGFPGGLGGSFARGQALGGAAISEGLSATSKAVGTASADDYSTTNVQVQGVDEPDIVKNDGKYIYAVTGNRVVIIDAFPPESARVLSTLDFEFAPEEIFINDDRLVVLGNHFGHSPYLKGGVGGITGESIAYPYWYYSPKALAYVYDVSDPSASRLTKNVTVDGSYLDARMVDGMAYVIVTSSINDIDNVTLPTITEDGDGSEVRADGVLYFDSPDSSYQFTTILALDADAGELSSRTILMGASQNIFASQKNVYVTYQKYISYRETLDRLLDALSLEFPAGVRDQISAVRKIDDPYYDRYGKIGSIVEEHLQALGEEERQKFMRGLEERSAEVYRELQKESEKTIIHRIAIDKGSIEYRASGSVPGRALNQFSMDEHEGHFRIATMTSNFGGIGIAVPARLAIESSGSGLSLPTGKASSVPPEAEIAATVDVPDPVMGRIRQGAPEGIDETEPEPPRAPTTLNHLYVLDMGLNIVGKLEDLAPDERIYSVRFLGERAYLVTFRQVDPLFVIDVSSPTDPRVLGQLKIPGFSNYLHPYDDTHIIGIGKEVQDAEFPIVQGVKLGLFDVSDPANPKELAKHEIGSRGTDSEALRDHKAFLFSRAKGLLVIPILLAESEGDFLSGFAWQGAYVFDVSLEGGFREKGRVTHAPSNASREYYYYFSPYSVRRSLYMNDVLYTVSKGLVKANSLGDLSEIKSVELPRDEKYP